MTDQELNEAVARKLGWKECNCLPDVRDEHRRYMPSKHEMPRYSNDIAAAWEVVDKYDITVTKTKEGHWYAFANMGMSETATDEWWFSASEDQWPNGSLADTAPRAICKVFLKLP